MPTRKPPTHGERFDALLQNLAAATGNDAEIEALHEIVQTLWRLLTPGQEAEFFAHCGAIETKAARWAGADAPPPTRSRQRSRKQAIASACECLLEAFIESGDLNDLPASQVIGMLRRALNQRDHPPAHAIARNAARIGYSFDWGLELTPARLEQIVAAAIALSGIESKRGFTWDGKPADWETVCSRIADTAGEGSPRSWPRHIRVLLGEGRRKRRRAP